MISPGSPHKYKDEVTLLPFPCFMSCLHSSGNSINFFPKSALAAASLLHPGHKCLGLSLSIKHLETWPGSPGRRGARTCTGEPEGAHAVSLECLQGGVRQEGTSEMLIMGESKACCWPHSMQWAFWDECWGVQHTNEQHPLCPSCSVLIQGHS